MSGSTCCQHCVLKEGQAVEEDSASTQVVEREDITLLHDILTLLEENSKHLFDVDARQSDISID